MINANSIKQRSLIASYLKYEKEINIISDKIVETANKGGFMLYIDPMKEFKIPRYECSGILNVFTNAGFITGIKDNAEYEDKGGKLIISWYHDLDKINLLDDYDKLNTIEDESKETGSN